MKFHGDLILTDPAFVVKDEEDWKTCAYGDRMDKLGIQTCLTALMTEGEEDLAAYDSQGNLLGTFVSDSGVVGAFLLEEIQTYDPDFDEHIVCPENALWLPDFHGELQVEGSGETQYFVATGSQPFTTH